MNIRFDWAPTERDWKTGQPTTRGKLFLDLRMTIKGCTEAEGEHAMSYFETHIGRHTIQLHEKEGWNRFRDGVYIGHLMFTRPFAEIGQKRKYFMSLAQDAKREYKKALTPTTTD